MLGDDAKLYMQLGHSSGVNSVVFSPDGAFVLTGSNDKTARLWDVATGREVRRFEGHSDRVRSVAFSPDGRSVLTSGDSSARLWDAATGRELRRFKGHSTAVTSVAFSPDGRFVLTGSVDNARLWDTATGRQLQSFDEGRFSDVTSVAFSRDGGLVLNGSNDKTARLWDAATGRQLRRLEGHSAAVKSATFSPDGRFVLTGSDDKTARLWDTATGRELRRFKGHSGGVTSSAFSPDGRVVLTGSWDHTARLWDVSTGREMRRFQGYTRGHSFEIRSVAFSPDGRSVLTGSDDFTARLWDMRTGAELRRFEGHAYGVTSVAFSPDGRVFLTCSADSAIVWDVATGRELQRFEDHDHLGVDSAALSPDGRFVVTGIEDKTVRLWDVASGGELRRFEGHSYVVDSVAFSPDGNFVLTGSNDKTARLWDVATGRELRRFEGHSAPVNSAAFSPDGRFVLTGSDDKTARLWDTATGRELRRFEGHSFGVNSVAFSPDGRSVLTGGDNARLWDAATGRELRRFDEGGLQGIESVAFSRDGSLVLTGSLDDSARLWDVATGRELRRFEGHSDAVDSASFSSDGRFVLTGSFDSTTKMWSADGQLVATLVSVLGGGWAVVDPDGRFDTSNLDGGAPLHWIIDSDPMRPLPLEIFMRDYYTPRLLARILNGEKLEPLRKIADIKNRVQPDVEIMKSEATPGAPNHVTVSVHAGRKTDEKKQDSGLQDLRLFRNGQMVGYLKDALKDGTYVFPGIQLPLSDKKVELTAYAFNSERIKSPTVQQDFAYTPTQQAKPKAYLVQIGVNHYQASGCELRYAVNDAHKLRAELEQRLKARGIEVNASELVSTTDASNATKEQIRKTLAAVAKQATPDDAFFLSFSGHGYTSPEGQFYILPSDIQGSCSDANAELLQNAISADELTEWLRPIDAGEMTFILDSCYSAKSVEANDFKPGPMGSRGLGQLAYDKRMRILAASQSDAEAMEDSRLLQGLLSYVLTEQGLKEGKADWKPVDKQITLGEWLSYAADQVPKLNEPKGQDDPGRGVRVIGNTIRRSQVPSVFDFSKKDQFVIQK